jgi:glutamine amidotransferase
MRVTIFDYGAGNLHSLAKALEMRGARVAVNADPRACLETDLLLLPGVGAFAPAVQRLAPARDAMLDAVRAGLPVVGICLGMQLLFDRSDEGPGEGLGVISGMVTRLNARRVPQIGWNQIVHSGNPLLERAELAVAYYANSYVCRPADTSCVAAWSEHEEDRFPAMVRSGSVVGVQFHPEKSSAAGVRFLRAMVRSLATGAAIGARA